MAGVNWEKINQASQGAALTESTNGVPANSSAPEKGRVGRPSLSEEEKNKTKTKTVRYPVALEELYKILKDEGRAAANFNDFIVQAIREKIDRDTR